VSFSEHSVIFLYVDQYNYINTRKRQQLRRKRRLNTQTIQRKPASRASIRQAQRKPKRWFRKFIIWLLLPGSVVGLTYYFQTDILNWFALQPQSVSITPKENGYRPKPQLPVEEDIVYTPIQKRIQVDVLNGCGEQGVAGKLSDALKKENYDVINMGNYIKGGKPWFEVAETKIIGQYLNDQNRQQAENLAIYLGVDIQKVESIDNSSPIADITVVIGQDYKKLAPFN
jgi:hypothetical protein